LQPKKDSGTLELSLHAKQTEIFHDPHRFKVVSCGRRFGKTTLCSIVIALLALQRPDQILWIVSPTFPQTMYVWRRIKRIIPRRFIKDIKEGEKFIELINGSTIWAKSGDNPDGLVGEGLDFCVIDEAARCKEEVWEVLRPALADKNGGCWFLSTPKGKNWFYKMFLMEREDPGQYKSFRFSSHDNPILPRSELDAMKRELPDIVYLQEVMAQFIDTGGIVFRNLNKCLRENTFKDPVPGHSYVEGVDLGKHQDFTVVTVFDLTTNELVFMDRFNNVDWSYQRQRIIDIHFRYFRATVILDSTGIGDVVYDDLMDAGVGVEPYKFTNVTKNLLITNVMRTLDNQLVFLPNDPDLVHEFEVFEYNISDRGIVTYGAPKPDHDDIVISVALGIWGLASGAVSVVGTVGDPFEGSKDRVEKSNYDEDDITFGYEEFGYEDEELPRYGVNRVKLTQ
jgi:hypothetical protein